MKFDDDFFKAEVREGFEITSMMKRAWAAQMEVFQVVADVCRKNKLRYFADWGTLLGAVRHKGMIPWDDDIDVAMPRDDFERLVRFIEKEKGDIIVNSELGKGSIFELRFYKTIV